MFVNKHSDFLALGFLTGDDVICTLGLLSVNTSGINSISASRISLKFCWSSHLPACWYIFLMLFIHLCSKKDLVNGDWSISIVFIWSSRRDNCNMRFITTHFCSNVLIDRTESMALFNTLDLTHWSEWGDLLLTWKHKYSLPSGGNCVVFGDSTGARGKLLINGVKQGGVDVAWTLILCLLDVTQDWISSVFEMFTLYWLEALPLCWRGWDVIGVFEIVIHDVWCAEDDNTGFLSVRLDYLGQLCL